MKEHSWRRVEDDDPKRCQSNTSRGQCSLEQMEGSNYCPAHGGNHGNRRLKLERIRTYRLERYQQRLNNQEDHPKAKSLTSELALLKMLLEELMNRADDGDIASKSPIYSDLICKIERLTLSCVSLDTYFSEHLDEQQASAWLNSILVILFEYGVPIDEIRDELVESYLQTQTQYREGSNSNLYKIGTFQVKLEQKESSPRLKTLQAEIGISRMMIEDVMKQCKVPYDLFVNATRLGSLITGVEKLVMSCAKIDLKMGRMLNATQVASWSEEITEIISRYVTDPDDRSDIAGKIIETLTEVA